MVVIASARKNKKRAPAAKRDGDDEEQESNMGFHIPKPDLPIFASEHKAYSSSESEFGDEGEERYLSEFNYSEINNY